MDAQLKAGLFLVLVVLILSLLTFAAFINGLGGERLESGCPADTKLCPDGSRVGRVLPDCGFPECPIK
jgi:hypothetical protein